MNYWIAIAPETEQDLWQATAPSLPGFLITAETIQELLIQAPSKLTQWLETHNIQPAQNQKITPEILNENSHHLWKNIAIDYKTHSKSTTKVITEESLEHICEESSGLTVKKTFSLLNSMKVSGFILSDSKYKRAIVEGGAVRWLEKTEFWELMHRSN